MRKKANKKPFSIYKLFIYVVLIALAVSIIVPVAWVFMASIKQNSEFYGNPWKLPAGFYFQNFIDAWTTARMGEYMLNSVIVTALALALLLVIALPAAYALSRFKFRGRKILNVAFMAGLFINVNYIIVPIFLMFVDGNTLLRKIGLPPFLLNNILFLLLSMQRQRFRLRFICYLDISQRFQKTLKKQHIWMARDIQEQWCELFFRWQNQALSQSFCLTSFLSGTNILLP